MPHKYLYVTCLVILLSAMVGVGVAQMQSRVNSGVHLISTPRSRNAR